MVCLCKDVVGVCVRCTAVHVQVEELELELQRRDQEVKDRDAINEFLRNEIRVADMKKKVMYVS